MATRTRVARAVVVTVAIVLGLLGAGGFHGAARAASPPNLVAVMTADQYVPPPLLPDGNALQDVTGTASISLGSDPGIICFELAVGIPPPPFGGPQLVGTIHQGAPGVTGPEVATLLFPSGASSTISCTSGLSAAVLADLFTHPERYYVQSSSPARIRWAAPYPR